MTASTYHGQTSQSSLSPALSRLILLAVSIAVWGAAGLVLTNVAQAQTGPYSAQSDSYEQEPEEDEAIAELQRHLAELGYFNGEITGHHGPQTQEAIVRFQQDAGLAADGIVGPETARALFQGGTPDRTGPAYGEPYEEPSYSPDTETQVGIHIEDSGDQVAELQRRLSDLGYYSGEISGVFDYPTEAAVMQFQRDNGLETDGVVGPNTEDTLRRPTEEIMRPVEDSSPKTESSETAPIDPQGSNPQASNSVAPGASGNLLRVGASGQPVSELQAKLQSLGFYQGQLTGIYDPETEAAVIAFQQSQGLTADGIAGPQVNAALSSSMNVAAATSPAVPNPAATASPMPGDSIPGNSAPAGTPTATSPTTAPDAANPQSTVQSTIQPAPEVEQLRQEAEQARLEAEQARLEIEQARLEAEQARLMLDQNFSEGQFSVAALQQHLRNEGIYPGEINGMLDSETQGAIAEAQRKHGLTQADLFGSRNTSVAPSF